MTTTTRRVLKVVLWIIAILIVLLVALGFYVNAAWDAPIERPVREMQASMDSLTIAHGEFLYKNRAMCWMCHSADGVNPNDAPSGGRVEDLSDFGPGFGRWYIPNITPDPETGIGQWTDGELVRLLREGIKKDGRPVFIMPSERFNGLSDEDVLAIVAYLRSLPPVRNPISAHEPSLFAKALFSFGVMKPQPEVTMPIATPPSGITVEWGKYLTAHASLCMDCHSPVDLGTGQFYKDSVLVGGNFPFGKAGPGKPVDDPAFAFGKNLTPDEETGIGTWTEEDFLHSVRTGMRPDSVVVTNHMPYAYMGMWSEEDLRAVFAFLKTLPATRRSVSPTEFGPSITNTTGLERGKALFDTYCYLCHGKEGKGAPPTKLVLADLAQTIDDPTLKQFIVQGQINLRMPSFRKTLTSEQIDDVVAFIRTLKK